MGRCRSVGRAETAISRRTRRLGRRAQCRLRLVEPPILMEGLTTRPIERPGITTIGRAPRNKEDAERRRSEQENAKGNAEIETLSLGIQPSRGDNRSDSPAWGRSPKKSRTNKAGRLFADGCGPCCRDMAFPLRDILRGPLILFCFFFLLSTILARMIRRVQLASYLRPSRPWFMVQPTGSYRNWALMPGSGSSAILLSAQCWRLP